MTPRAAATLLSVLAVAVTIVVWAAAFPAIRLALAGLEPLPLASIRFAMAGALALAWLLCKRPTMMSWKDLAACIASGIVAGAGYSVFLNLGQETVPAGTASFLVKTESLWMTGFAIFFLGERFTIWAWAGTMLAVAGVGLIAMDKDGGMTMSVDSGTLFVLAAAVCSASGFTLQRDLVARHGAFHVAAVVFIVAALTLMPWLPAAFGQMGAASMQTVGWVIFLGIFPTTIGLVCWTYALGHFGVARCGNFLYLVAPLAVLIAWIIAGERPSTATLTGGALIIAGVVVVNRLGRRLRGHTSGGVSRA